MDDVQGHRQLVVAHVSYRFLIFTAAVHVMTAYGASLFVSLITKIEPIHVFPAAYVGLIALTSYLVLRNGRWAVDDRFIYKGWRLAPFIVVSEIECAQIGLPDNWVTTLSKLPVPDHLGVVKSMQRNALLVGLSGNRWLIWEFSGMVNCDQFILAILDISPRNQCPVPTEVIGKLSLTKVGTIIQG